MIEVIVKSKFFNSPTRIVYHNKSDNTIHIGGQIFSWDYFFEVNELSK